MMEEQTTWEGHSFTLLVFTVLESALTGRGPA
jgi:hypothetical protein